jgi:hypothetical protein
MWHVYNFVLVAMCIALCGQTAKRLHQFPAVVGFPLAVHQDVVQVRGGLFNPTEGPVDELLKGVSGVPQAEGHAGVLEQAEHCVMMAVLGMPGALVGTWWYPFFRSILKKWVHPAAPAAKSSMLGTG